MALLRGRAGFSVEPSFWLTAAFLAWSGSGLEEGALKAAAMAIWMGVVFLAVAWHEAGHAATALAFGAKVHVRLHGFGGDTRQEATPPLSAGRRMLVTAAGPAAGFLLAGLAWVSVRLFFRTGLFQLLPTRGWQLAAYAFQVLTEVCVAWSVFNLLPIAPLDGGALVAAGLQQRWGLKGLRAAYGLGLLVGGLAALYLFAVGQHINALIVVFLASNNINLLKAVAQRAPQDDDPALQAELKALIERMEAGQTDAPTARRLYRLSRRAGRGAIHRAAAGELGVIFAAHGRPRTAYRLLAPLSASLTPQGRKLLEQVKRESAEAALRSAQTSQKAGDARRAAKWLKTAFSLDARLRERPEAAALLRSLGA